MPTATAAHAGASRTHGTAVTGWLLDAADRTRLLGRFAPAYPDVIAHHVTLTAGTARDAPLPEESEGEIVGIADDGRGVQALVVRIDGTTKRPDGSVYHITWSLDRARGRKPQESNQVIRTLGWSAVEPPVSVRLHPGIVS